MLDMNVCMGKHSKTICNANAIAQIIYTSCDRLHAATINVKIGILLLQVPCGSEFDALSDPELLGNEAHHLEAI